MDVNTSIMNRNFKATENALNMIKGDVDSLRERLERMENTIAILYGELQVTKQTISLLQSMTGGLGSSKVTTLQ